jgi:hypothetical protein
MRSISDFRSLANLSNGNIQAYISACGAIDPSESSAFLKAWNDYASSQNKINSPSSTDGNVGENIVNDFKVVQNLTTNVKSYNIAEGEMIQVSNIITGIQGLIKGVMGEGGLLGEGNFSENLKTQVDNLGKSILGEVTGKAAQILQQEVELHNDINSKIGISGELSRGLRNEIVETLPEMITMGYGFEDVKKTITGIIEEQGKFTLYNREVMGDMAVTSRAFVGDLENLGKMISTYEKAGYGAAGALERINEAGESSISLGLNARKVVAEIETNMKNLNSYGFKNGYDGLTKMVQKSIEFKMSMQNVFTLAEKLFDPDQAVALSANLQAIGGAIGDFNDPLKLMYMATNDAGGLQDAMIGVAGSLATYNSELGKFEITGVNLRKARALAGELGMTMDELSTTAIKAAERTSASADLLAGGFNLDEKQQEFITNLARMEGGKMVIDVPKDLFTEFKGATRVALEDLNDEQVRVLLDNQKVFEEMNAKDIALSQYTETQKLGLQVSEIVTMMKVQFAGSIRGDLSKVDEKYISEVNQFLKETKEGTNSLGKILVGEKDKMTSGYKKEITEEGGIKANDMILRPDGPPILLNSNDTIYAVDETKNRGNNVTTENKTMKIEIVSNVNADAIRNDIMNQMAMTSDYREYIGTFS